jgi:hypothetical protein
MRGKSLVEGQVNTDSRHRLDGVYEFVSETTTLTKPRKASYKRMSPEWTGIWQFQNGSYTCVLMKGRRDEFFNRKKLEDVGFESFAGPYELEGERLRLMRKYTFHPWDVGRSKVVNYRVDGDTLTLIEALHPYVEDLREGTITTILRRVK